MTPPQPQTVPMLDLATAALLDKSAVIGACTRLSIKVDAARRRAEVDALPPEAWATTGGRVGVHRETGSLFLRGYAPAEGPRPIEDRAVLDQLPYSRHIIETQLGSAPLRCLMARLPGGKFVAEHADIGDYFAKTIRIHVPVITHPTAWMMCDRLCYVMAPGEVWALNNSARHAVWNADPAQARTHMICDFLPTPALLDLLARGERGLGATRPDVEAAVQGEMANRASGG